MDPIHTAWRRLKELHLFVYVDDTSTEAGIGNVALPDEAMGLFAATAWHLFPH